MAQDNYEVYFDDNITELRSKDIDLKITSERILWRKFPGESKYVNTGKKVPPYMTKRKKAEWLADLRNKWLASKGDERGHEEETEKNDDIVVTMEDDD